VCAAIRSHHACARQHAAHAVGRCLTGITHHACLHTHACTHVRAPRMQEVHLTQVQAKLQALRDLFPPAIEVRACALGCGCAGTPAARLARPYACNARPALPVA
jgi:hypothetical protein